PSLLLPLPLSPQSTPLPYTTLFRSTKRLQVFAGQPRDLCCVHRLVVGAAGARASYLVARPSHHRTQCNESSLLCCGHRLHNTAADRKSTRLNSSHVSISYAVFCLKK